MDIRVKELPVWWIVFLLSLGSLGAAGQENLQVSNESDQRPSVSCAQFMASKRTVNGQRIGQEDCRMQDVGIVDADHQYRRVDMGISGTLAGWIVKAGPRSNHFTSAPDFVYTQTGNTFPRFHGILRYEGSKGTALTLVYPQSGWNGKLFVTVHGGTGSFRSGSRKPWDQNFDPAEPMGDLNKYEKAMLAKGYAVAVTKRNAAVSSPGDFSVTLDNGDLRPDQNIGLVPELILDMVGLTGNFLQDRLGQKPTRTYWYGFSGGAMTGSLLNYMSGVNIDHDGTPLVDGFIWDDMAGGLFLPVLMKNGEDVLFRTQQDRTHFTRTIAITHQLYPAVFSTGPGMDVDKIPEWVSPNYLINKRRVAMLFREKGLDSQFRMYEVRGVSHSGGETLEDGSRVGDIEILPLWRFLDGVIDLLDNWVERGVEPPPTKSDLPELLGSISTNKAVDLPETACPLGVYFPYPPSRGTRGGGTTALGPFDGESLEPEDGRKIYVDMNLNGRHDRRETVTEAWQRLGLMKGNERFNRDRYVECVKAAVSGLTQEGFITKEIADLYIREAAERQGLPER